jgi:hypothetical protein
MGVVILICIAVYRLTHFITKDAFPPIAAFREYVGLRFGEDSSWAYLVECPWCVSIYVGAAVVVGTSMAFASVPLPVLVWLTSSAVTGLIATYESRSEEPDAEA